MDLSFVILTWNSEKYITGCLKALIREAERSGFAYEVFLVDNGSKDQTVTLSNSFRNSFPERIFPIFLGQNFGTTYSRNLALKKAQGRFICVLDSDVELAEGTIQKVLQAFDTEPDTGIVAPQLRYKNGELQKSTDRFPNLLSKIYRFFFLKIMEKKEGGRIPESGIFPVDYAISALWFFKRSLLANVGFLDESIFYAPEDADFCLRVWKAGKKVMYLCDVASIHHTQEISRELKISSATINHVKGLFYYFRKHDYLFSPPVRSSFSNSSCIKKHDGFTPAPKAK